MREFGIAAGMAFQIVDDVLDLIGDESYAGKSLGRDLAHGSVTLPVIHCLANATGEVGEELRAFVRGDITCAQERIRCFLDATASVR